MALGSHALACHPWPLGLVQAAPLVRWRGRKLQTCSVPHATQRPRHPGTGGLLDALPRGPTLWGVATEGPHGGIPGPSLLSTSAPTVSPSAGCVRCDLLRLPLQTLIPLSGPPASLPSGTFHVWLLLMQIPQVTRPLPRVLLDAPQSCFFLTPVPHPRDKLCDDRTLSCSVLRSEAKNRAGHDQ